MKALSKIIFLTMVLTIVSSCKEQTAEQKQEHHQRAVRAYESNYIDYIQDTRTGICFVRSIIGDRSVILAPVECTEKVKKLLVDPLK